MKNAIILHGMPSKEGFYNVNADSQIFCSWMPWLHQQLMIKDILTQIPSMPRPYAPVYEEWVEIIKQFKIDSDTVLIGHSCGAGFWVRYLSEKNIKVSKLILVAPWLDPHKEIKDFFDFEINLRNKVDDISIFYSRDDDEEMKLSFELLVEKLPTAKTHVFEDRGHFTLRSMKTREFPELLKEVLV